MLILCASIAVGITATSVDSIRPRVIDGVEDFNNEFPFVVLLGRKFTSTLNNITKTSYVKICTGSLLAPNWVLTAEHCLPPVRYLRMKTYGRFTEIEYHVRYGDMTVPSNASKSYSKMLDILNYPGRNAKMSRDTHDIALVFVQKVPLKTFGRVSAVDYLSLSGRPVKYAGFGVLKMEKILDPSINPLQVGEGVILIRENPSLKGHFLHISPKCSNKHQQASFGDSGGPAFVDGRIVGVAYCIERYGIPVTIYTAVSPYSEWIFHAMLSYKQE